MNEYQAKVIALLEKKDALSPCPRCKHEEFTMNDSPFGFGAVDGSWAGMAMPCAILACKKCGYVFLHSIKILEEAE